MAASPESIPTGPGYKSLIISILVMVLVPAGGLWGGTALLVKPDSVFQNVWNSKYDLCGRLWLLASFISTTLVTVAIMFEIIRDERFNSFRKKSSFNRPAITIIILAILLPIAGLGGTLIPSKAYGMWIMKFLALFIAVAMLWLDTRIRNVVRAANESGGGNEPLQKSLEKEFTSVVQLVDIPTTFAIALVMVLSALYLLLLPAMTVANEVGVNIHDSEIFVQGLSSGAVAVELWFANFLFWMMLRRHDD